jgi:hypothetical protein
LTACDFGSILAQEAGGTVMTERRKIEREVGTISPDYRDTVLSVIESLQKFVDKHGHNCWVETKEHCYQDGDYLAVMIEDWETDEEMARRIQIEEHLHRQNEERERDEFERLRAKFGG